MVLFPQGTQVLDEDVERLLRKAYDLAIAGNHEMLKFLIVLCCGEPVRRVEVENCLVPLSLLDGNGNYH